MIAYLQNVVAGLSHLINALTGGSAMNSFSARVGWRASQGAVWAIGLAAVIDACAFSRNHCAEHAREEGLIA